MVRVKAPLMSLDASGTIGKSITFSAWKGRNYVRRHAIPANPRSGLQVGIRAAFKWITQGYAVLPSADKAEWAAAAVADNITPLDAQVRDAIDRARRNLGWRENKTAADPASISVPTSPTATAQPKSLVIAWVDPASSKPDACWAIYGSISTGFTKDISNLIAVVAHDTFTWTYKGLTTGVAYYFQVRGMSKSGFLGTATAQFTGTPT